MVRASGTGKVNSTVKERATGVIGTKKAPNINIVKPSKTALLDGNDRKCKELVKIESPQMEITIFL